MTARTTFAKHDEIAASKSGSALLVGEPIVAQVMPDGYRIPLSVGEFLRVKFNGGGLWCELARGGRVVTVVVDGADLTALDAAPSHG